MRFFEVLKHVVESMDRVKGTQGTSKHYQIHTHCVEEIGLDGGRDMERNWKGS